MNTKAHTPKPNGKSDGKHHAGPLSQDDIRALNAGTHANPYTVLGPHYHGAELWVVCFQPHIAQVWVRANGIDTELHRLGGDVFAASVPGGSYQLVLQQSDGTHRIIPDPFAFGPRLGEIDHYLIGEGKHHQLWRALGAHVMTLEGVEGTHFAVWAPNAQRVAVVGDFNQWDGRCHPMRRLESNGIWEVFLPAIGDGALYKFEVVGGDGVLRLKADPMGFGSQHPPEKASTVRDISGFGWQDDAWMKARKSRGSTRAPVSIYEVHLGSWRRRWNEGGRPLSYKELAHELIDYVVHMGFTHIELLPVSEFPFDGSWGYQPVGMYAPTIRFGPPHEFRDLIEAAHAADIGVLLDWVPGHFPTDEHGLANFDGTALYEHADPREGFHLDWNTLIYNYGRTEVRNYLVSNALYWLEEYHVDGLRVDAVASMLYRDYSRPDGEWIPNKDGGRENYEAIDFLKEMNVAVYGVHPDAMTVAEESTSFPGVSRPTNFGGLGFGYKWNMGWMNDTLSYMQRDPIHRSYHHDRMTFGIHYAFSENFVLPISHDEVVHGKGSMLDKMPGSLDEKFANLRAYYTFMWTHPGKKLLFMGCEFAQPEEWNHEGELNWAAASQPGHAGVQALVRDLNHLYRNTPALHTKDCEEAGFKWLNGDPLHSTLGFVRYGQSDDVPVLVMCNFTPVMRENFQIGVPKPGHWEEVLNCDSSVYGGGNRGNMGGVSSQAQPCDGFDNSVQIVVPPLSVVVLKFKNQ